MSTRILFPLIAFRKRRNLWKKLSSRFLRKYKRLIQMALLLFILDQYQKSKPYPPSIPAQSETLKIPRDGQDLLTYAHQHGEQNALPVYMFYKARSGQLNNQLVSFFNALAIAKQANATLVAPFAFYGKESYLDFANGRGILFFLHEAYEQHIYGAILRKLGIFYKHDELVGAYLDGELLNQTQPVVSIMQFLRSRGGDYLRTFPNVLTRRGEASFYYMSLGKRQFFEKNVNVRGTFIGEDKDMNDARIPSRRELDCNFNATDYFRGLPFHGGVNGNYLFFGQLFRSHSLNCTSKNLYWMDLRRYVQPRLEIREVVAEGLRKWGRLMTLHLRLFPFDINKFETEQFCTRFLSRFQQQLNETDRLYIAYSVSSHKSVEIVSHLRQTLGESKILTAVDYGYLEGRSSAFHKRYALPLVDMWTCVTSHFFVGRLGSSLSWNVVYWREAFTQQAQSHMKYEFYSLKEFSTNGVRNPTDSYDF